MARSKAIDSLDHLDDDTIRRRGMPHVCQELAGLVRDYPEARETSPEQKADLARMLNVAERAEQLLGRDESLFPLKLMILGKLGRFDEAKRLARLAYDEDPTWGAAVAAANALRRCGDVAGAVEMFRAAARLDPEDVAALLDLGDLLLDDGQWQAALEGYEEALKREKDQPWAVPSAYYCRYRLTGDDRWLKKLKALADAPPDECGVADLLAQMLGGYSPDKRRRRAKELLGRCEDKGGRRSK